MKPRYQELWPLAPLKFNKTQHSYQSAIMIQLSEKFSYFQKDSKQFSVIWQTWQMTYWW